MWTGMKLRRELKKSVGAYLFSNSVIDKMNLTQGGNLELIKNSVSNGNTYDFLGAKQNIILKRWSLRSFKMDWHNLGEGKSE